MYFVDEFILSFLLWKMTKTACFECISLCLVPYPSLRAAQHIVLVGGQVCNLPLFA
uniref:Uncharacterized protein n=2 Tax=Anguilla anguilla TaxID=7936 RepID=A0A0E9U3L5_ANGAN